MNQLDHILIEKKIIKDSFVTAFKNFISDHKAITIRIPKIGNLFNKDFEALMFFDEEHHLKQNKQREPEKNKEVVKSQKENSMDLTDSEKNSLNCRSWVKDGVIDKYFNLLQEETKECALFGTDFYHRLKAGEVKANYKEMDIFTFKKILIPILDKSHSFLILFEIEESRMSTYDPYDFSGFVAFGVEEKIEENRKYHEQLMKKLVDMYFLPMFEKVFPGFLLDIEKSVITHK